MFVTHHLCAFELRRWIITITFDPRFGIGEGVFEAEGTGRLRLSADWNLGHDLHTAGDDHVVDARHHGLCGEMDRLL